MYGLFFLVWSVVLLVAINWQTSQYLEDVVGNILEQRVRFLSHVDREQLPGMLATSGEFDLRGATYYGLFDAKGDVSVGQHRSPAGRIAGERRGALADRKACSASTASAIRARRPSPCVWKPAK